jgi:glyoxylase-like metal-dependent hydrolase (beta-lactamase superfamily II)
MGSRRAFLRAAGARCALGWLALAGAVGASAQDTPGATAAKVDRLDADLVKTGLYLIRGGGANSLLRLSANGMVLVDGKRSGNYRALMAQVRRISKLSDMPVRVLVLTDPHDEHAGNSGQFVAAGIPIVAQRNAVANLALPQPADAAGHPVIAYDREYTLRMGGVEVQLKHFGNARTGGDTVVYFPDLKVVALGDLFMPGAPEPDFSAGGSLVGWSPVLAQVLELDFDQVVPCTGPVVGRRALAAFKEKVDTVISRAGALVRDGVGRDELMSGLRTEDLGWQFSFSGAELERFYAELSGQR